MSNTTLLLTIIVQCTVLSFTATAAHHDLRADANNRAYVQALCDWSHTHNDGNLEMRCGAAQDKTNTEYLCVTRSTALNCWVEVK